MSIVREGGEAWWFLHRHPISSQDEDEIYFVLDGVIRYKAPIYSLDHRETTTDEGTLVLKPAVVFRTIAEVDPPIPMRGFQGFRYYDYINGR